MKIHESLWKIRDYFSKKKSKIDDKVVAESNELANIEKQIQQETQKITIYNDWRSTSKIIKFWLIWLLVVALWYFGYNVLNLIFLIISAYIFSIIVESLVAFLERKKMKRSVALFLSYLIFVIVLLWFVIIIIPFIFNQVSEFLSMGLSYVSSMQAEVASKWITAIINDSRFLSDGIKEYIIDYIANNDVAAQLQVSLQKNLSDIVATGQTYISRIWSWFIWFISGFATFFAQFLLFFTLSILFSVDKKNVTNFLSGFGWKDKYKVNKLKIEKVYKNMAVWLKARLLLSLYISITVWITLVIMWWCGVEIPNKLWIAVIAWLLDIIPYIWPIFTWILLFVVAILYNSFLVAILIVIILYVFNLVQENVLTPVLMKKALGISPVLILISMMLWWVIMWFLWVLLSVPIAVILVIFFWHIDIEMNDTDEILYEIKDRTHDTVEGVKMQVDAKIKQKKIKNI